MISYRQEQEVLGYWILHIYRHSSLGEKLCCALAYCRDISEEA